MNIEAQTTFSAASVLGELAELGLRASRVVVRMMEIEQAAAEAAADWLPRGGADAASMGEAAAAGHGLDIVDTALVAAVARVDVLARALDRVSRSVRRSVALLRRVEAGWPRAGSRDDRVAMTRRQVARGVGEAIRRQSDGEAAERLFDELAERLDDPALDAEIGVLPVEEVVRRICCDLGLVADRLRDAAGGPRAVDTC